MKEAIERALQSGDLFSPEHLEEMRERLNQMTTQQREQLIERLIEKLEQSGYVSFDGSETQEASAPGPANGKNAPQAHFEITDKAVDFLGFKTLKDLLGIVGQVEFWRARHTRTGDGY